MVQRTSMLNSNSTQLNSDYDFSRLFKYLLDDTKGVLFSDLSSKPEFDLNIWTWELSPWFCIIKCTRAATSPISNQEFYAVFQSSEVETLDVNVWQKIFIELDNTLIQNPTLIIDTPPATDYAKGLNIGEIKSETSRPSHTNYIKLWEVTAWPTLVDHRETPLIKWDLTDLTNLSQDIITSGDIIANDINVNDIDAADITAESIELPWGDVQTQIDDIISTTWWQLITEWEILWEDVVPGQVLFPESMVTFASATNIQNIGDVTNNKRFDILWFGSGVNGNTIALSLKKFSAPTVSLSVRIETDDGSWNPSGTLVHANADTTVTAASLTTSLANTTVTFPWSFTIAKWTPVHTVVKQVWDNVDAVNYYGVGRASYSTSTRITKTYNGTVWSNTGSSVVAAHGLTLSSSNTISAQNGSRILTLIWGLLTKITKHSSCTATRALLLDDALNILATASFSGDDATFSYTLLAGVNYYVMADNSGSNYTERYVAAGAPVTSNLITFLGMPLDGNSVHNIASVTFTQNVGERFVFQTWGVLESTLLSLASAAANYKLPTDIIRVATETKTKGNNIVATFLGLNGHQTSMTAWTPQFLTDTPWAVWASPGQNLFHIGRAHTDTSLSVEAKKRKTIVFSYNTATASGNVVVNHNLGFIPTKIKVTLRNVSNYSYGTYDARWNKCIYGGATLSNMSEVYSIRSADSGSDFATGIIWTVNSKTFTIAWTKNGSASGTVYLIAEVEE